MPITNFSLSSRRLALSPQMIYDRLMSKRENLSIFNSDNDFLIASFPKSGSTWLRFILSNYLHYQVEYKKRLRSTILKISHLLFASLKKDDLMTINKFGLKTHSGYLSKFSPYKVIVLVREALPALESYFHYLSHEKQMLFNSGRFHK